MKISDEVLNILDAAEVTGNQLKLVGQLERKLYADTNKVLEALGGKWNRKVGAHVFDENVEDILEQVIQTGEYARTKQDFGQFDTPQDLAKEVVAIAEISPQMRVLEPSAGDGNIAVEAIQAGGYVHTIELDPKRCAKLTLRISKMTRNSAAVFCTGQHHDFLLVLPSLKFDRVVMNPPFAGQADIDHVHHALSFLKPDGCLTAIMSTGTLFRQNHKATAFRERMSRLNAVWKQLPEGAFAASGTQVRTMIVRMWADGRSQGEI